MVFYSKKAINNCKYCYKNSQWFCISCKEWLKSDPLCKKHELTLKRQKISKNEIYLTLNRYSIEKKNNFVFINQNKTYTFEYSSEDCISSIKSKLLELCNQKGEEGKYYVVSVKDESFCYERKKLSECFNNFDFYKKNWTILF